LLMSPFKSSDYATPTLKTEIKPSISKVFSPRQLNPASQVSTVPDSIK
jgi:hypothetical protein